MSKQEAIREVLQKAMADRKMSLRRLALKAEIPSGRLSEILNGRRPLTTYYLNKIVRSLKLSPAMKMQLESMVANRGRGVRRPDRQLHQDEVAMIREWYYFAILNLLKLSDFKSDPSWIAKRLGLSEKEVVEALKRLLRLELIQVENDTYVRTSSFLSTTTDIPSWALQEAHLNKINKAAEQLKRTPVEFRDISSMTLTVRRHQLPEIKNDIRRFRQGLAQKYEKGAVDEVYNLSVQFVPYTVPCNT